MHKPRSCLLRRRPPTDSRGRAVVTSATCRSLVVAAQSILTAPPCAKYRGGYDEQHILGQLPTSLSHEISVRARPGRLSALSGFYSESVLYGAFVWARGALNRQKLRFPARVVPPLRALHALHADVL